MQTTSDAHHHNGPRAMTMSDGSPATSTGSLASQRHPGKFPKVPGRRRGTRGFPAAPRESPIFPSGCEGTLGLALECQGGHRAKCQDSPLPRGRPVWMTARREAPADSGNVRVDTRPPQRPNPASRPADSTQATESQGRPHLYTTAGESAKGHRGACPGGGGPPMEGGGAWRV